MNSPVQPASLPIRAKSLVLARVVIHSAVLQMRVDRSPTLIVQGVVQPAAFTFIALLARRSGSHSLPEQTMLGCGLICLWGVAIWQAGLVLRRELWEGTLIKLMSQPTPLIIVLVGKSLGATARAALLIAATVECIALIVGEGFVIRQPLPFFLAAVAAVLSASAMGLLLSCLFLLSRAAIRLAEMLGYPVFILGGLLIPVTLLPSWADPLSTLVSLRWAGEILRAAAFGQSLGWTSWAWLGLTSLSYAAAGSALFALVVRRAKRMATLDIY